MKTCLYNFDPLQPHFYIVKLGFTWVYIIFLISTQNSNCRYSLEPPHRGGSNEYPQSMFWAEIWKISKFLSENFQFLEVKFAIYLNRRVFVMDTGSQSIGVDNLKSLSLLRRYFMNGHGLVHHYFPWPAQRYFNQVLTFTKKLSLCLVF